MLKQLPASAAKEDDVYLGLTDRHKRTIYLNAEHHASTEDMEHTFLHELVHALLFANGRIGDHNEEAVDRMAGFLHQYEITKRGELNGLESGAS